MVQKRSFQRKVWGLADLKINSVRSLPFLQPPYSSSSFALVYQQKINYTTWHSVVLRNISFHHSYKLGTPCTSSTPSFCSRLRPGLLSTKRLLNATASNKQSPPLNKPHTTLFSPPDANSTEPKNPAYLINKTLDSDLELPIQESQKINLSNPLLNINEQLNVVDPLPTLQPTCTEVEIAEIIKRISKDEKLLRIAVGRSMSPKNKKRWIQALIQQLEFDLIDKPTTTDQSSDTLLPIEGTLDHQKLSTEHKDKADQIFRILDVNQDGFVGLREFRIWFSTYYLNRGTSSKSKTAELVKSVSTVKNEKENTTADDIKPANEGELSPEQGIAFSPTNTSTDDTITPVQHHTVQTTNDIILDKLSIQPKRQTVHTFDTSSVAEKVVTTIETPESTADSREATTITNLAMLSNHGDEAQLLTTSAASSGTKTASSSASGADIEDLDDDDIEVEWKVLAHVMLRSSIPYLAFGIIDNGLMLTCGEWIDSTVAVRFCLSTMAAAGLGNTLSCATGVVTGGFIERMCLRSNIIGKYSPVLTPQQSLSPGVRNAHIAGSVLGIICGCLIGMFPLLLVRKSH